MPPWILRRQKNSRHPYLPGRKKPFKKIAWLKAVNAIKYLLMALLAGVLMWIAYRGVDLQRLLLEIQGARISWIALSIVFSVAAFISGPIAGNYLSIPLGYTTSFSKSVYSLMTGYLPTSSFRGWAKSRAVPRSAKR
jgi:hypothetical protein